MRLVILFSLLFISASLFAQERCAQVPYEKMIHPQGSREADFEQWIKSKTTLKRQSQSTQRTQAGTYTIPVVVHVIHNGEAVGTGTNISDAQIQSQIEVLNKDYRRLNTDATNTLSEFQSVAGSMDIQFVLAKQDPEGLASNGIVRVKGTKTGWNLSDGSTFKSLSYWRADHYLNIWVINFTDPGGYIGYAQLPLATGTTLGGLEDASTDSLTDGVTIHYTTFGSVDGGSFILDNKYNKGRTATHEIGHFFGLRHIWGDTGGCSSTDYVDDTPIQDTATRTCPTTTQQSCGHSKMFQNYLDYTDDNCMNLFTVKQIERMDIVINNCIRRKSLLTSPGALTPVPVANDLGIKVINTPQANSCSGSITPTIVVKNYGSNTATSCRATIKVNGAIIESKDFAINLAPLADIGLAFSAINLLSASSSTISFEITLVNGVADAKASNNTLQQSVTTPANAALPITELFNSTPSNWIIQNPDGLRTWQNISLTSNSAMMLNFYDYENEGAVDRIISPVFNLSNETSAILRFDYAYAQFPGVNNDSLSVVVITDCGAYLANATTLFNKGGSNLSTTSSTTSNSFTPTASQWKTETFSLLPFIGQSNVQIAFIARNGYGNNLYIDNVFILNDAINDLALTEIKSPGPVFCVANPQPVVKIKNQGSTTVTSFKVETTVNAGAVISQSFTGIQLATGEEKEFTLNALQLSNGQNTILFNVKDPNGIADNISANNSLSVNRALNQAVDIIPLRENFDSSFAGQWTIISQGTSPTWQLSTTNYSSSLFYNAFTNTNAGQQSWLVSPVLDFSQTTKAGLLFDVSYAMRSTGTERLQMFSSTDCGITYPDIIYDRQTNEYSSNSSSSAWLPAKATDWQSDFINLNALAGKQNVRLAFVITNQNGNNLYLDNLNFYQDDDANPPQIDSRFYVYATSTQHDEYNITFNLTERADASVQIYNLIGQKVAEYTLPNTLNQTYPLNFDKGTGIYIVKTQIGSQVNSTRVMVSR